jgi:hypothetical protein
MVHDLEKGGVATWRFAFKFGAPVVTEFATYDENTTKGEPSQDITRLKEHEGTNNKTCKAKPRLKGRI